MISVCLKMGYTTCEVAKFTGKTNEYPLADEEWILDGVCQIVRGLKLQGTIFCGENYHPKRMVQPNFDPR